MKILIINGYTHHTYKGEHFTSLARGRLAETLVDIMENYLSEKHEVVISHVQDGYKVEEEQEKFLEADIVIMHTPIYWFNVPAGFKKYIDDIYAPGIFTGENTSKIYGDSGMLKAKYMFSLTWNAPLYAFENGGFMEATVDEAIKPLHKMNQFVGMKPLKTFSVHDVIKNPRVKQYEKELIEHLKEVVDNEENN